MDYRFYDRLQGLLADKRIYRNEPMKNHTTFKLGGNADLLVNASCIDEIVEIKKLCNEHEMPVFFMGNGSNLIVRDGGIRGLVVKIFGSMGKVEVNECQLEVEAGILLSKLSKVALENGLTGLEFAEGIPGTLGGAVIMNAGAYNGEMSNVVTKTIYMDENGDLRSIEGAEHCFGYRTSSLQKNGWVVLKSFLTLKKGNKEEIKAQMDNFSQRRRDKQPLELPSAGSVFKRPEGFFAGQLIENSGLRGFRIGGAQVSEKHCGFIVNTGDAKAADVLNLINHIKDKVYKDTEVTLETEVRVVGEE